MHPRMSFCVVNCWSRGCVLPARGRTVGGACPRRHHCPRTQTRSVTLGVRGSPAPGSAVRPVRASNSSSRFLPDRHDADPAKSRRSPTPSPDRDPLPGPRGPGCGDICRTRIGVFGGGALLRLLRALRSRFHAHFARGRVGRNPSHSIF